MFAIITITGGENFGNRLQNLALQSYLKSLHIQTETINNLCGTSKYTFIKLVKTTLKIVFGNKITRKIELRKRKFRKFNRSNITFSRFSVDNNSDFTALNQFYDGFICGSDQIWNPDYPENQVVNFLDFVQNKIKISYAASFGVSQIPENRKEEIKRYLTKLDAISVREKVGQTLVETLTGIAPELHLDPTLLLTEKQWIELSDKSKCVLPSRYIFLYFLGDMNDELYDNIYKFALDNKYEIVNPMDVNGNFYVTDPFDFIQMIRNAKFIFTDSFHGSVFSIIFKKRFQVFNRNGSGNNMNSRIDSLLSISNLGVCKNNTFKIDFDMMSNIKIDWDMVEDYLNDQRRCTLEYFNRCIVDSTIDNH